LPPAAVPWPRDCDDVPPRRLLSRTVTETHEKVRIEGVREVLGHASFEALRIYTEIIL
jgi:hypothetical protein